MRKLLIALLLGILTLNLGATDVSGVITENTTWTKEESPYVVTSTFGIPEGVTLTIEPGVVVQSTAKEDPYVKFEEIVVRGGIHINGAKDDSVEFQNVSLTFKRVDFTFSNINYLASDKSQIIIDLLDENASINELRVNNSCFYNESEFKVKGYIRSLLYPNCILKLLSCKIIRSDISNYAIVTNFENTIIDNSEIIGLSLRFTGCNVIDCKVLEPYARVQILKSIFKKTPIQSGSTSIVNSFLVNSAILHHEYLTVSNTIMEYDGTSLFNYSDPEYGFDYKSTAIISRAGALFENSQIIGQNKGKAVFMYNYTESNIEFKNCIFDSNDSLLQNEHGNFSIINSTIINTNNAVINHVNESVDATQNYWGIFNENLIHEKIYDQHDDIDAGLVDVSHFLTTPNIDAPISSPQNVESDILVNEPITIVSWSSNLEEDVAGYIIYYGKNGDYSFQYSVDVGIDTVWNLEGDFTPDEFVVVAYDTQADGTNDILEGHESWSGQYLPNFQLNNTDTNSTVYTIPEGKYWVPEQYPEWDSVYEDYLVTEGNIDIVYELENIEDSWNIAFNNLQGELRDGVINVAVLGERIENIGQGIVVHFVNYDTLVREDIDLLPEDFIANGTVVDLRQNPKISGKIFIPAEMEKYTGSEGLSILIVPLDVNGYALEDHKGITVPAEKFNSWVNFIFDFGNQEPLYDNVPPGDHWGGGVLIHKRPIEEYTTAIPVDTSKIAGLSILPLFDIDLITNELIDIKFKDLSVGIDVSYSNLDVCIDKYWEPEQYPEWDSVYENYLVTEDLLYTDTWVRAIEWWGVDPIVSDDMYHTYNNGSDFIINFKPEADFDENNETVIFEFGTASYKDDNPFISTLKDVEVRTNVYDIRDNFIATGEIFVPAEMEQYAENGFSLQIYPIDIHGHYFQDHPPITIPVEKFNQWEYFTFDYNNLKPSVGNSSGDHWSENFYSLERPMETGNHTIPVDTSKIGSIAITLMPNGGVAMDDYVSIKFKNISLASHTKEGLAESHYYYGHYTFKKDSICTYPQGDFLNVDSFVIIQQPRHAEVSRLWGEFKNDVYYTYIPEKAFNGTDTVVFANYNVFNAIDTIMYIISVPKQNIVTEKYWDPEEYPEWDDLYNANQVKIVPIEEENLTSVDSIDNVISYYSNFEDSYINDSYAEYQIENVGENSFYLLVEKNPVSINYYNMVRFFTTDFSEIFNHDILQNDSLFYKTKQIGTVADLRENFTVSGSIYVSEYLKPVNGYPLIIDIVPVDIHGHTFAGSNLNRPRIKVEKYNQKIDFSLNFDNVELTTIDNNETYIDYASVINGIEIFPRNVPVPFDTAHVAGLAFAVNYGLLSDEYYMGDIRFENISIGKKYEEVTDYIPEDKYWVPEQYPEWDAVYEKFMVTEGDLDIVAKLTNVEDSWKWYTSNDIYKLSQADDVLNVNFKRQIEDNEFADFVVSFINDEENPDAQSLQEYVIDGTAIDMRDNFVIKGKIYVPEEIKNQIDYQDFIFEIRPTDIHDHILSFDKRPKVKITEYGQWVDFTFDYGAVPVEIDELPGDYYSQDFYNLERPDRIVPIPIDTSRIGSLRLHFMEGKKIDMIDSFDIKIKDLTIGGEPKYTIPEDKYWVPEQYPEWDSVYEDYLVTEGNLTTVTKMVNIEDNWEAQSSGQNYTTKYVDGMLDVDIQMSDNTPNWNSINVSFINIEVPLSTNIKDIVANGIVADLRENFKITGKIFISEEMSKYTGEDGFNLIIKPVDIHEHVLFDHPDVVIPVENFNTWVDFTFDYNNQEPLYTDMPGDPWTLIYYFSDRPIGNASDNETIPVDTSKIGSLQITLLAGREIAMENAVNVKIKDLAIGINHGESILTSQFYHLHYNMGTENVVVPVSDIPYCQSLEIIKDPAHSVISNINIIDGESSYAYSPESDFVGTDTVYLKSYNNYSITDTVLITITVPDQAQKISLSYTKQDASAFGTNDGFIDLSVSGGVPPYAYQWSNGNQTQDIFNLGSGSYTVFVSDNNNGFAQLTIPIINSSSGNYSISGTVYAGDHTVTDGVVLLYAMQGNGAIPMGYTTINIDGSYNFVGLSEGRYTVYAIPNSSVIQEYMPTYAYHAIDFSHAEIVHLEGEVTYFDISLRKVYEQMTGNGYISGNVHVEDINVKESIEYVSSILSSINIDINANVSVYLMKGREVIDWTYADSDGNYEFPNLDFGDYEILVENPGVGVSKILASLTEDHMISDANNFSIKNDGVYSNTDAIDEEIAVSCMPNPVSDYVKIEGGNVKYAEIVTLTGIACVNAVNSNILDVSTLSAGQYFVKIVLDSKTLIVPIVVE